MQFYQTTARKNSITTFTYTTSDHKRRHQQEDNLSVISKNHSSLSMSSILGSSISIKRVNQIKPTTKINISNCSTIMGTKKNSSNGDKSLSQISPYKQSPKKETICGTQSLEYNNFKPIFNWDKLGFFCGIQRKQLGINGCECGQSCPWKKQWTKNNQKKDYAIFRSLLRQKPKQKQVIQINKDIKRTHPECPTFSDNPQYQKMLRQVLIAYSIYDIQVGYVQGLNMIAGVLLYHIKNSQQTFWALVQMMDDKELRMIYLDGFVHLQAHCQEINNLLMSKVNDLYNHMKELQIISSCFLNGWLLSLMSNCIPMQYMHKVIDKFKKIGWQWMYKLIIAHLLFLKTSLIISSDQAQFLTNLSTKFSRDLGAQWSEMIDAADKLKL